MVITNSSRKAMVLAAGLGTRLRPLTDRRPKALVPVCGRPLINYTLRNLEHFGFHDITVNVYHFADMLCDYLAHNTPQGMRISISSEREKLLDTGGALRKAADILYADNNDVPVLVHNVDILSNMNLSALYDDASGCDALLLVSRRDSSRRLLFETETMRLVGWKNLLTGELRTPLHDLNEDRCVSLAFAGIHVVGRKMFVEMQTWPEVFSIIDFYLNNCVSYDIRGYMSNSLQLIDVGKTDTLATADDFVCGLGL